MKWLEAIEKVVVIFAAILAAFPLYQFWIERENRQVDRAANFVVAHVTCADVLNNAGLDEIRQKISDLEGEFARQAFIADLRHTPGSTFNEDDKALIDKAQADLQAARDGLSEWRNQRSELLKTRVSDECGMIRDINLRSLD